MPRSKPHSSNKVPANHLATAGSALTEHASAQTVPTLRSGAFGVSSNGGRSGVVALRAARLPRKASARLEPLRHDRRRELHRDVCDGAITLRLNRKTARLEDP